MILAALSGCSNPAATPTVPFPPTQIIITPSQTSTTTQVPSPTPSPTKTLTMMPTNTIMPSITVTPTVSQTPTPRVHICDPAVRYFDGHFFSSWPVDATLPFKIDRTYSYGAFREGNPTPHHGIDLTLSSGTIVSAVDDGKVIYAGDDLNKVFGNFKNYYGTLVLIEHEISGFNGKVYSLYGHLSEINVSTGDAVSVGQEIGKVGITGISTGSHLHFEVRFGSASFDETLNPELWLPPRSTDEQPRGSLAGYILSPSGNLQMVDNLVLEYYHREDLPPHSTIYTSSMFSQKLNQDVVWQENFAAMDLIAGNYKLSFYLNGWEELSFEIKPDQITLIGYCLQD